MSQKRALKRIQLRCPVKVFDAETDEELGQIIDIHCAGLLLMSVGPIDVGSTFTLRLQLPEPLKERDSITFEAQSVWGRNEKEMGFHTTGFSAPDIPAESKEIIDLLTEKYGITH